MTLLLDVWARGALVVCLGSLNTRLLADGRWSAIGVATLLSCVWWLNARSASRANGPAAMVAYATGAGCGTAVGLWLATL